MNSDKIIKVCGMRDIVNIIQISGLPIDIMGFIFLPSSPRFVEKDGEKEKLKALLRNIKCKKAGVFVNEEFGQIIPMAKAYNLDIIQLHGSESPDLCKALRKEGYSVIKVFSIEGEDDFGKTEIYDDCADFFLFDTKCNEFGGSGKSFDWNLLNNYKGNTPFIISGGIDACHKDAINQISHKMFAGIDINSRFEISPAIKDVNKIKNFINSIKQ